MQFSFSAEQEDFRGVLRRFLQERSPTAEVRRLMETPEGFDREVWKQACSDLGLAGIHLPEEYGGQGFGFVELGIALEESGRALLCAPFFASAVLAANAVLLGATEARRKEILPAIASGETIATLAITEPDGRWEIPAIALTATPTSDGWRLDGTKSFVLDGHTADQIVVAARLPDTIGTDGIGLFVVPGDVAGLDRRLLPTMDATRKLARLAFSSVPAEPLGEPGTGADALERTLDLAHLAPEAAIRRLVEFTFDYSRRHPELISLINNENLHGATHLRKSKKVRELHSPFVALIADILRRGVAQGVFRPGLDPVDLYITIAAVGYFYLSNNRTLSTIFGRDLGGAAACRSRKRHNVDVILHAIRA